MQLFHGRIPCVQCAHFGTFRYVSSPQSPQQFVVSVDRLFHCSAFTCNQSKSKVLSHGGHYPAKVRTRLGPHLKWCSSSSSQLLSTLQMKKKETRKTNQTNKQTRHGLILASLSGLRICACVDVQCYHSRVLKFFQNSRVQQKMKHSRIIMSLREVLEIITHLELEIEANQKWKATRHQAVICMHFPFSLLSFFWSFKSLGLLNTKLLNPKYQLCFFRIFCLQPQW